MKRRDDILKELKDSPIFWDVIVIGGGATGLGAAVDAAARGYRTILLEQSDFSKGTSSRSTKLIHGGVRYLQQGNVRLVLEALRERGILIQNAPHLVHNLPFIVPNYDWWEGPFYGIGLKLYDMLAGRFGLGPSSHISRSETLRLIPTLEPRGLRGGIIYHDAQFDDSRLAVDLARTLEDLGGTPLNYVTVTNLLKAKGGFVEGVVARDALSGAELEIRARVVVNATGVFADRILRMDDPDAPESVVPSQGVHIVLDKSFLPGESAIMVPHTADGRVLFAVPWHNRVIVGTTDTPVTEVSLEPRPLKGEIDFLLTHAARYLTRHPAKSDVLCAFAGLRPLVRQEDTDTAFLSREHAVHASGSGLVTITGGKWTTYRKMGEDVINTAADAAGLDARRPVTANLRIHGWLKHETDVYPWDVYGTDIAGLKKILQENPDRGRPIHPGFFYRACEVIWSVRHEWACTVEDVLARRTRALLLDAKASMEAAPEVASLMARELGYDQSWEEEQVRQYRDLASGYLLT